MFLTGLTCIGTVVDFLMLTQPGQGRLMVLMLLDTVPRRPRLCLLVLRQGFWYVSQADPKWGTLLPPLLSARTAGGYTCLVGALLAFYAPFSALPTGSFFSHLESGTHCSEFLFQFLYFLTLHFLS